MKLSLSNLHECHFVIYVGRAPVKQREWTEEEISAVEATLMDHIKQWKVPGKEDCVKCLEAAQQKLSGRSWEEVRCYMANRIDNLKRQSKKM